MILNSNDGERGITRRSSADVMKGAGPGQIHQHKETETKHCSGYINHISQIKSTSYFYDVTWLIFESPSPSIAKEYDLHCAF